MKKQRLTPISRETRERLNKHPKIEAYLIGALKEIDHNLSLGSTTEERSKVKKEFYDLRQVIRILPEYRAGYREKQENDLLVNMLIEFTEFNPEDQSQPERRAVEATN